MNGVSLRQKRNDRAVYWKRRPIPRELLILRQMNGSYLALVVSACYANICSPGKFFQSRRGIDVNSCRVNE